MNKILVLTICIISLALSTADEIDTNYNCRDLYEYNAATKGEVASPFYYERDRYHDELWCEYRIRAPQGNTIKVSFKALDIAPSSRCHQDYLFVYSKDKKKVLGIFCGTELPRPIVSLPGESEIRLLFRTDSMVSGKGWVVEYESSPNLELCETGLKECRNRKCYDPRKKCDGEDDCGDGTDEENCGFPLVVEPELCGTPVIQPKTIYDSPDRMVGGDIVIPNSWPWQVSLQGGVSEPNGHFCGGTLINAQWVVSATHCVVGYPNPPDMKIVLGAHHKYKRTKYQQIRYAEKIIAYPDLERENTRKFSIHNDLSLIKLNAPVKFNDGVQPACLPTLGWTAQPGWHCYITGWGETRGSGGSDELKQQEQIIQSDDGTCNFSPDVQICVDRYKQSPCHGDSGGPLVCKLGGRWVLFGAASYVTETNFMTGICTGPGAKSVYSSVGAKVDWIRALVNKYS